MSSLGSVIFYSAQKLQMLVLLAKLAAVVATIIAVCILFIFFIIHKVHFGGGIERKKVFASQCFGFRSRTEYDVNSHI